MTEGADDRPVVWPPQAGLPEGGLVCRECGCRHFYVVSTRPGIRDQTVVRRRECRHCGRRITTIEQEKLHEPPGRP